MPRISVVVPLYNVERYAVECLESVAAQTVRDLEVVVVDDGSTDASAQIAEGFAERDPRFRVIRQANGGLGNARNAGTDAAGGEFLAFVDGDDVLPRNAYELLLRALEATGSDFATGNVQRLRRVGKQSRFLAQTFEADRLRTHVTRFRPLLRDRIAPNKLWRREFWDGRELRFPEGVVHEDIPVVLPAHFMARAVDVIARPVYYYRIRDTGELSITQRRLEPRVLLDRLSAVEHVRDFLAREGLREARRWYEESVVADDLRYFLDELDRADDAYRRLFLDRVNAFLDTASPRIYGALSAIHRLKWHLVRERRIPELLEVLRFEREDLAETPPVRIRGRWYGDYPYLRDRRARIPRSVYRLEAELRPIARVETLGFEDGRLRVEGWAYIGGIGAPARDTQSVSVVALRPGRLARARMALSRTRLELSAVRRPDVTAAQRRALDATWSGFAATLDPRRLRAGDEKAEWRLFLTVRAGRVRRRAVQLWGEQTQPPRAVELPAGGAARLTARPIARRRIAIRAQPTWARVDDHRLSDGTLELTGRLGGARDGVRAQLSRGPGSPVLKYPLALEGDRFALRVPVADLLAHDDPEADPPPPRWLLHVVGRDRRHRLAVADAVGDGLWALPGRQLALGRTIHGDVTLRLRAPRPVLTAARWAADGTLELSGELAGVDAPQELLLAARDRFERHPVGVVEPGERFSLRLAPFRVPSLAGERPLREGAWELQARAPGRRERLQVIADRPLGERPPQPHVVGRKSIGVGATAFGVAVLEVSPDLAEDERGPFHRSRLRRTAYAGRRSEPLRDAVLYASFGGRECSDSPRAIHAELARRGTPLEHLWVVDDARFAPPAGAGAVRAGSREHHEALARCRFVVTGDALPRWFERREGQTVVQTGPGRAMTLHAGAAVEVEVLRTGVPRTDVLLAPGAESRRAQVRARLDLPDGVPIVLYAPTWRDYARDRDDRPRLDVRLELPRLRRSLAGRAIVLFRPHPRVVDAAPGTRDGFVRDVSSFPDCAELLLAADALVTDYSSVMFDFANTGRPMVFFAYDLGEGGDFPVERAALPGPVVRTTGELAAALADLDFVRTDYARRYEEFAATFCALDDGGATARVVERVFAGGT